MFSANIAAPFPHEFALLGCRRVRSHSLRPTSAKRPRFGRNLKLMFESIDSIRAFRQRPFIRGMISLAGGTALGQFLLIVTSPILTRIYRPDEMGKLGLFTTFVSFCAVGVVLGYETSIVGVRDTDEADALSLASLLLVVPMSLLCAALAFLCVLRNYAGYGVFPPWVALLIGLGAALNGWLFVLRYRCIRDQRFEVIRRIPLYQNLGRGGGQVVLGILGWGWGGLCLGELLGRGLGLETVGKG